MFIELPTSRQVNATDIGTECVSKLRTFLAGKEIKTTAITQEFTYDRFRATYGDDMIPLFILSGRGQVTIVTAGAKVAPSAGQSIIALVNRVGETTFDKDRPSGAASDNDEAPVSFA